MIIKIIIFVLQIIIFLILMLWTTVKININIFNYNKNKNICTANNNIFHIKALIYNRNINIYSTNNNIFNINIFNYDKNNNIYGEAIALAPGQAREPRGVGVGLPLPGWEPGPRPHVGTHGAWSTCPCAGSGQRATWRWPACPSPKANGSYIWT
jgi:hypothetical protein